MRITHCVVLVGSILFAAFNISATAQTINVAAIDSFITYIEQYNQGIGEVAISQNGKIVYDRAFGKSAVPPDNGKYRIGSVSKLFTAILIHRLYKEKELTPNTTLENDFPIFPTADSITINHMLSHRSGLADYVLKEDTLPLWLIHPVDEAEILNEIVRQGVLFAPGKDFRYSNTAYYLLRRIVERRYGLPYRDAVARYITTPLGMYDTEAAVADKRAAAPSYQINTANCWQEVSDFYFPNVIGVGDIISTPQALIKLIEALFSDSTLGNTLATAMQPQGDDIFGCGMMMMPFYEHRFYGHAGDTFGTHSVVMYNPTDSIAIALCLNGCSTPRNTLLIGIASAIYDREYTYPDFSQLQQYIAPPDSLSAYAGTFCSENFPLPFTITYDGKNLSLQVSGQPPVWLESKSPGIFVNTPTGTGIAFRDKDRFAFRQFGNLLIFNRVNK